MFSVFAVRRSSRTRENLAAANHLINSSETELGHDGPQLVGHVVKEKLIACSGVPVNFFRSSGSWVAIPTRACVDCVEINVSG